MYINFGQASEDEQTFTIRPRRRKSYNTFTLRLTSMIDMFTILLIFLLKSYSAEGEIFSVSKDLHLPESTAQTPPRATPILIVTNEWIILDGNPVEKVSTVVEQDNIIINNLTRRLLKSRSFSENLGKLDVKMGFKGTITIQGDKEIPFEVLKKIMYTCGQVGYNNMFLAVNQEEHI